MTPKEFLNQPRVLRDLIKDQENELKMLEAGADGMTGISFDKEPVKVSIVQSGTEEYLVRIENLKQSIDKNKRKYTKVYHEVYFKIHNLTNERERKILLMRYIEFKEWEEIFPLFETQDVVYSLHKRALNRIRC